MGKATAERKAARKAASKPKPELTITKAVWDGLPREQKKRHKDGSRFIRKNRPGESRAEWVCVVWHH